MPKYKVVGQRESSIIGPDGHFHDVIQVTAVLDDGTHFTVNVPRGRLGDTEYVRGLLDQHAAGLTAISEL